MLRIAGIAVPKISAVLFVVLFTASCAFSEDELFSPIKRVGALITAAEEEAADGTEELTEMQTVVLLLQRIEKTLVYVLVMSCFVAGQMLWRLTVLSKSQRNIL